MDTRLYPQGKGGLKSRWVAGVLTFYDTSGNTVYTIDPANRTIAVPSGSILSVPGTLSGAGSMAFTGTIALTGAQNNRMVLGAAISASAKEVGALSGNFLGLELNFANAGTTLSRLTGMQIDVEDTSTHSNTIACARFYSEKVSGVGSHEHWAIMAQTTNTAGKVANTCAGMFINIIKNGAIVGTDGGGHRASAIVAEFDMGSTADIATSPDAITGAILGYQIGNSGQSAAKKKSVGIFCAVLGGDSAISATGAFFKAVRKNSISASKADYGLDLYYAEGGGYLANVFAVGDIRLGGAVGPVIMQGTSDPNGSLTKPKGSLHIDTTNATLKINTDAGTTWSATG